MKRRNLLNATLASAGAALLGPSQAPASGMPRHTVSAEQLQLAVDRRFPLRFSVSGLLQLTVRAPVLRLLPEANRIATAMAVVAAGPALARASTGEFDLDFSLRYESGDRTLRAHRVRVRSLRVPGLPAPYPELLDAFGQTLARQTFGEVVLHRLQPQDLALAEVMGFEPDSVTVTPEGLLIGFALKPPK